MCGITYIGETSLTPRVHMHKYLYDISQNAFKPVPNHLNYSKQRGKLEFQVTALNNITDNISLMAL